ncbi:MAG: DUF1385 domain-containing protein [Anaerolineales bacterium]|jgi:uncharacterized protein YqhQ
MTTESRGGGVQGLSSYGGQAVLEGVMMRGSHTCAVAVRAPDGSITFKDFPLGSLYRSRFARMPFIRGLFVLWDSLVLGVSALTFSANVQTEEDEPIDPRSMALTLLMSLALGIGFFFLLPAGLSQLLESTLGWHSWWANLVEGVFRLVLLIGYIWAIGRLADIERVYGYHGAEHKTINAYEAGAELTPENVSEFPREHPRCGTAFLLTVVVFSILLFSALGPLALLPKLLSRLILLPLLAALAYEYIRFTARLLPYPWARPLAAPNLWLQQLTTREPDEKMIEVAIAAFRKMRAAEDAAAPQESQDVPAPE